MMARTFADYELFGIEGALARLRYEIMVSLVFDIDIPKAKIAAVSELLIRKELVQAKENPP